MGDQNLDGHLRLVVFMGRLRVKEVISGGACRGLEARVGKYMAVEEILRRSQRLGRHCTKQ